MHDHGVAGAANELVVGADDRTGALETAGAVADAIGEPVAVVTGVGDVDRSKHTATVVDIATRYLPPPTAAERAAALDDTPAACRLHKIDSTLRGNWAHELVARQRRSGRPTLLVPALPALGRTCVDGVVLVDGRPVHETGRDARGVLLTSRPSDVLVAAGASHVLGVTDDEALVAWLGAPTGIAVVDATTGADLARIATRWADHRDVLLAGPSAVMACGAAGGVPLSSDHPTFAASRVLIVSGSLHDVARRQVAHVLSTGARRHDAAGTNPPTDGVIVLETRPVPGPVEPAAAARAAASLAEAAVELLATWRPDALVILGGDTAAAVLGDGPVIVRGTVAPGTPWARIDGCVVVTRAGGFGGDDALADLVWGTLST